MLFSVCLSLSLSLFFFSRTKFRMSDICLIRAPWGVGLGIWPIKDSYFEGTVVQDIIVFYLEKCSCFLISPTACISVPLLSALHTAARTIFLRVRYAHAIPLHLRALRIKSTVLSLAYYALSDLTSSSSPLSFPLSPWTLNFGYAELLSVPLLVCAIK